MALISPARGCMEARCAMLPVICVTFPKPIFPCVSEGFHIRRGCDARLGQPIRWREFRWGESQPRPPLWIIRSSEFLTRHTTLASAEDADGSGRTASALWAGVNFTDADLTGARVLNGRGFSNDPPAD